ncbi:hypothetical protein JL720_1468 [Aureococcus anophagefferens]|nr:hypothetical protein JL720_1468 [Aureococcus anophagefferens]
MNTFLGDLRGNSSNNTTLTIKSSPPKTAAVATRLGVRTGVLTKRNEQQVWQRRYCALVPQTLLYYYDGEHSESARGIIDLEYYTEVEVVARNTIRLSTPPDIPLRSFFFKADDEDQCAAWAAALTRSATSDALAQLRQQAVSLGLSESSAAVCGSRAAVREVAHRLHYHMRRAAHLGDAVAGAADQETSGGGAGPSDEERPDARRSTERRRGERARSEETARLASEGTRADKAAALDDAQRRARDAERPKPPPPRPPAGASPFAKVCRRCGGTVEGPRNSTCKCAAPQIDCARAFF